VLVSKTFFCDQIPSTTTAVTPSSTCPETPRTMSVRPPKTNVLWSHQFATLTLLRTPPRYSPRLYLYTSPSICPLPLNSRACPSKRTAKSGLLQYEGRGNPSGRLLRLAFDTIHLLPSTRGLRLTGTDVSSCGKEQRPWCPVIMGSTPSSAGQNVRVL